MRDTHSSQALLSISLLKEIARKLKRAEGIPLHEALQRVAERNGFATWHHATLATPTTFSPPVIAPNLTRARNSALEHDPTTEVFQERAIVRSLLEQRLSSNVPLAAVEMLTMPPSRTRVEFHRLRIGGRIWSIVRRKMQLHLCRERSVPGSFDGGAAYMGHCTRLTFLPAGGFSDQHGAPGWHVVKYGSERTINISDMSHAEIAELAYQFGLRLDLGSMTERNPFFESPAFASVARRMQTLKHSPPLIQRERNQYLGGWFPVARAFPASGVWTSNV